MSQAPLRPADLAERWKRFLAEFTAGIDRREVRRLFDEDATQAFRALAGRRPDDALPDDPFERGLINLRDVAIGFLFKLSPARRLLFTVSLLCTFLGILDLDFDLRRANLYIDSSPFWFLTSIAGLTLLLALELVDRLRVRDELEVARSLQRDLLPSSLPTMPGYLVSHSYETANEIGGDYYDLIPLDDGRIAVAVGDASGHGMAAGLLMAIANATLKGALDVDPSPQPVIEAVDRSLLGTGGRRAFMTLIYGVLEPEKGDLKLGMAGHPFPLVRRGDGRVEEIGSGSLPLGLRLGGTRPIVELHLEPGDLLVLYSDGIPEASNADGVDFGFDRLRSIVGRPGSAATIHDAVRRELHRHMGGESPRDDHTLVVLERLPPLPPRPLPADVSSS